MTLTETQAKALKLLEALAEDHHNKDQNYDHLWHLCRTCQAAFQFQLDHDDSARLLIREVLVLIESQRKRVIIEREDSIRHQRLAEARETELQKQIQELQDNREFWQQCDDEQKKRIEKLETAAHFSSIVESQRAEIVRLTAAFDDVADKGLSLAERLSDRVDELRVAESALSTAQVEIRLQRKRIEELESNNNAIESIARDFGYNPEGAEVMGYTESSLADFMRGIVKQL